MMMKRMTYSQTRANSATMTQNQSGFAVSSRIVM